ncbi:hypothetical protein PMAYCL1PPCAC_07343, partial [Pristionchus mayeri]
GELFIEVLWGHRHIFLEIKESESARELRLMLAVIYGEMSVRSPCFFRRKDLSHLIHSESSTKWEPINETLSLAENGVTSIKARPNDPFVISILFPGDQMPSISSLSIPPPLPDSMRAQEQQDMN